MKGDREEFTGYETFTNSSGKQRAALILREPANVLVRNANGEHVVSVTQFTFDVPLLRERLSSLIGAEKDSAITRKALTALTIG